MSSDSVRRSSAPDPHTAGGADILVVDDEPRNLTAMEAALGDLAGGVVLARSGNEALRLLLRRDFALILLDVQMPGMDGYETARFIRTRNRSRHTPIIFITAYSRDDREVLRAYQLGAVDFLFKPLVPEMLRAKAGVFVALQRRTEEVARQAELLRDHERREHERLLLEEKRRWEAEALLSQMQRMAEADRRKDEFLAILGHELRNPLAPLVTGLELLKTRLGAAGMRDVAIERAQSSMERQLFHMQRLVDELLDVSRINSGKIELRKERTTLAEVIEQAVATSQPAIDGARHQLTVRVPPEPVTMLVDPVRMTQVLSNLLNNAARYTEAGGRIRLEGSASGGQVIIRVKDNGRGISPEVLPRIFEMFVQERGASGGLGLGLTLVRTLVGLHGGEVTVQSEGAGKGSEFEVRLPLEPAEIDAAGGDAPVARETAPATASASAASAPGQLRIVGGQEAGPKGAAKGKADSPLRIVLVEDNADIREGMLDLLSTWGHSVEVAENGVAGAALVVSSRPDVALIDIGLPGLDGYEVARTIRAELGSNKVRLIALTGFGQENDRKRAMAAGFDGHLVKPPTIEKLRRLFSVEVS